MDFLLSSERCLWVGNHAKPYFPEVNDSAHEWLHYEATKTLEGVGGDIETQFSKERIPCAEYTPASLACSLKKSSITNVQNLVIGDPSEWVVAATIGHLIEHKALVAVFFIYPVGMAALDSRQELAQLILRLKSRNIPTFLIRDPNEFFQAIEPNFSSFVKHFQQEVAIGDRMEYLCGLSQRLKGK